MTRLQFVKLDGAPVSGSNKSKHPNPGTSASQTNSWFCTNDYGYYDQHGLIYLHGQFASSQINGQGTAVTLSSSKIQYKFMELFIEDCLHCFPSFQDVSLILSNGNRWDVLVVLRKNEVSKFQCSAGPYSMFCDFMTSELINFMFLLLCSPCCFYVAENFKNLTQVDEKVPRIMGNIIIVQSLPKTSHGRTIRSLCVKELQYSYRKTDRF